MLKGLASIAAPAALVWAAVLLPVTPGVAQTPEQQQLWDAQRAQSLAAAKARAEQLERERAARKAESDVLGAYARSIDERRLGVSHVADDGSWAAYSTDHQLKRSGKIVTIWLRQEFAEPQHDANGDNYLSTVQKVDYDCGKDRARPVLVMYYSDNNIRGSAETEEADPKQAPWNPIVPGTLGEYNFLWACNREHAGGGK